jgi:hypothetical protein
MQRLAAVPFAALIRVCGIVRTRDSDPDAPSGTWVCRREP